MGHARYAKLTEKLGCKNNSWYLQTIDHEMAYEMDRICHPYLGKDHPDQCQAQLLPGRFTITVNDAIPRKEYMARRKAVADRVKAKKDAASSDASSSPHADEL